MKQRQLGRNGPTVSALGFGAMTMSGVYEPAERSQAIAALHRALDLGINLVDTADFYG